MNKKCNNPKYRDCKECGALHECFPSFDDNWLDMMEEDVNDACKYLDTLEQTEDTMYIGSLLRCMYDIINAEFRD